MRNSECGIPPSDVAHSPEPVEGQSANCNPQSFGQATFRIEGLDCAEEVAILRKEFGGADGVVQLDFDLLGDRMSVEYDPERITPEKIVAAAAAGSHPASCRTCRASLRRLDVTSVHTR